MAASSPRCQCAQQACSQWKREGEGQRGPTMQLKLLVKCDDRHERKCLDTDTLHKPEANSGEMRKGRSSLSVSCQATQNHVLLWLNISQLVPEKMSLKSSLVDLFCTPFLPDSPCIPIQKFNVVVNSSCRHRTAYHILCICSALRVLHICQVNLLIL